MEVSRQSTELPEDVERGPRARTRRLMLETAIRLMQSGATPSVSEVAEAAEVSRATAYRYFPSQAALVEAVVDEALGPILTWESKSGDVETRVGDLFRSSMPRIRAFEATFRAALKLSLEQGALAETGGEAEPRFTRGHRVDLLADALRPLRGTMPAKDVERLAQGLSMLFGIEALIVLKDIWGLNDRQAYSVAEWAALSLVRSVIRNGKGRQAGVAPATG
jgi:AcrR family transcriptional regulator